MVKMMRMTNPGPSINPLQTIKFKIIEVSELKQLSQSFRIIFELQLPCMASRNKGLLKCDENVLVTTDENV